MPPCHLPCLQILFYADWVFLIAFTVEMLLKLLALGVCCPKDAYCRDPWNLIDGFLVIGGWLTYLPFVGEDSNLSSIRVVRVLRPLRTINSIKGLRVSVLLLLLLLSACGSVACN